MSWLLQLPDYNSGKIRGHCHLLWPCQVWGLGDSHDLLHFCSSHRQGRGPFRAKFYMLSGVLRPDPQQCSIDSTLDQFQIRSSLSSPSLSDDNGSVSKWNFNWCGIRKRIWLRLRFLCVVKNFFYNFFCYEFLSVMKFRAIAARPVPKPIRFCFQLESDHHRSFKLLCRQHVERTIS